MFLLDTDTIIYTLKGHQTVLSHLQHHMNDAISISVVSLMELYYGAYKSRQVLANIARIRTLEVSVPVVSVDIEVVDVFGAQKAQLERAGTPLDDFDLILASTALARNLVLVTNNTKHFQRIAGLRLANWTETL